ncbi:hypothetical protein [Cohnella boryungensis]|uniref:Proline dehydrogenase n=1 Tax=Cohnella boryungensis TaxID=768479 RepID=A0ABV8S9R8_9BACL
MGPAKAQELAAQALRAVACNDGIAKLVQGSRELYPLLYNAARRYMAGESREDAVCEAVRLGYKGYGVSLCLMGKEAADERECSAVRDELLRLVGMLGIAGRSSTILLNLSHIGMAVDRELTYRYLVQLIREAAIYGIETLIECEEESGMDDALDIYKRAAESHSSLGMTLMAHWPRTDEDIREILPLTGRIRIVTDRDNYGGDQRELVAEQRKERGIGLIETALSTGRPVSIAGCDEAYYLPGGRAQRFGARNAEIELPYGVRPEQAKQLKEKGCRTRVRLPYGKAWFPYFLHRLADHPSQVYRAIADIASLQAPEETY